ncbi:Rieske (2Fe-2S) protein [Streptomyces sp. SL13]|uniref:Rieske (2Fe-2S) protein n=1 Tax=Streptantibioticus silvisoli TaxID=2705255 RepID=A0AA90H8X6_9ACTN|nr:Rieske (2Fe-2S) protein [Streptantibioticus silvisoli]MDI5972617.1 Rieske (2Fe-2S) protein [Streptantibioticus silvisoli]
MRFSAGSALSAASAAVAAAVSATPRDVPGRAESALLTALDAIEEAEALDAVTGPVRDVVRKLPLGRLRDVLHGRALGHPLHPVLVQLPMGAWLSAAVLDLVPGSERAAGTLVAVGLATAGPAAAAGWVDWAELHEPQMRTGIVHAASNAVAVSLYGGSLAARLSGRQGLGRALGWAGLSVAGVGGMLGGHLAYRQAAGPNKAEPVPHLVAPGWHAVGRMEDFPVGVAVRATVGEVPVLVVRTPGGTPQVLADRCSHLSGPLSDGRVVDGCVTCPWHGSVFRLSDGHNVKGPATAPQPRFDSRVLDDGTVEVRLPGAG